MKAYWESGGIAPRILDLGSNAEKFDFVLKILPCFWGGGTGLESRPEHWMSWDFRGFPHQF
jgi:hypothetical protein